MFANNDKVAIGFLVNTINTELQAISCCNDTEAAKRAEKAKQAMTDLSEYLSMMNSRSNEAN